MADVGHFSVPATSANLGPGFGVLGVALDLPLRVELVESDVDGPVIDRSGWFDPVVDLRHDRVWRGLHAASERFDIKVPTGLTIALHGDLPRGCGLGSNAAEFAAGVGAALRYASQRPSTDELLNSVVELGGDPGHGAAALQGGLVIAVPVHGPTDVRRFRVVPAALHEDWRFVVVAPRMQIGTADLQRVVPPTTPHAVTQRTVGRLAGLLHALATGDAELLRPCLIDEVHVPFRQTLADGMREAMTAGCDAGAAGVTISGHGPALLAFALGDASTTAIGDAMVEAFAAAGTETTSRQCTVENRGALSDD